MCRSNGFDIPPVVLLPLLHASRTPLIHQFLQTSANNRMLWVPLTHDIIEASLSVYIVRFVAGGQPTNMSNAQLPAYTPPAIVRPYRFPDPSPQARPPVPGIDPLIHPPPPSYTRRPRFTAEDLARLVRVAARKEPWKKPHGEIMKAWGEVLDALKLEGRFETSSAATIQ